MIPMYTAPSSHGAHTKCFLYCSLLIESSEEPHIVVSLVIIECTQALRATDIAEDTSNEEVALWFKPKSQQAQK
jgi:hypothetical protein